MRMNLIIQELFNILTHILFFYLFTISIHPPDVIIEKAHKV